MNIWDSAKKELRSHKAFIQEVLARYLATFFSNKNQDAEKEQRYELSYHTGNVCIKISIDFSPLLYIVC